MLLIMESFFFFVFTTFIYSSEFRLVSELPHLSETVTALGQRKRTCPRKDETQEPGMCNVDQGRERRREMLERDEAEFKGCS